MFDPTSCSINTRSYDCFIEGFDTADLVFPAADGRPVRRSNALRYELRAALRKAGLRRVNMHSLRHSVASAFIVNGAAVTEIKRCLVSGKTMSPMSAGRARRWYEIL